MSKGLDYWLLSLLFNLLIISHLIKNVSNSGEKEKSTKCLSQISTSLIRSSVRPKQFNLQLQKKAPNSHIQESWTSEYLALLLIFGLFVCILGPYHANNLSFIYLALFNTITTCFTQKTKQNNKNKHAKCFTHITKQ